ncbi:MAG: hypothetical protein QN163_09500 [Armatimonadota bacterium]|nr:hypothetical protein [Armatimonadota bacterium]MDR5697597.1 hypothetical protein [Armatimonadota bacterium]
MEERSRILQMVREGRLSVEEADRLLRALEADLQRASAGRSRVLRVRITSHRGDDMNVALPLAVADMILRFLPKGLRVTTQEGEVDLARLVTEVRDSGAQGAIVDVTDHRGDRIQVTVE